jgi:hypothetical protein
MLLLMDESGDKGPDMRKGSSRWLVVAGVLFGSRKQATSCRDELVALRTRLGRQEFHFREDADTRRTAVFECLAGFPFTYHVVACDKTRLNLRRWQKPDALFHEVAGRVIDHCAAALTGCTVWFDTVGGREKDRAFGKVLTRRAGKVSGKSRIEGYLALESRKEPLAQIADYVCGAVARSVRAETENADRFRHIIRGREGRVEIWPDWPENKVGGPIAQPAPSDGGKRSSAEKPPPATFK